MAITNILFVFQIYSLIVSIINYAILTGLFLLITKFITNLYLVAFLFILGYAILCIVESKLFGENHPF